MKRKRIEYRTESITSVRIEKNIYEIIIASYNGHEEGLTYIRLLAIWFVCCCRFCFYSSFFYIVLVLESRQTIKHHQDNG